ncbi:MAG: hypothetical protein ACON5A_04430 [Candidatus Comchoanobacterales bacterium]
MKASFAAKIILCNETDAESKTKHIKYDLLIQLSKKLDSENTHKRLNSAEMGIIGQINEFAKTGQLSKVDSVWEDITTDTRYSSLKQMLVNDIMAIGDDQTLDSTLETEIQKFSQDSLPKQYHWLKTASSKKKLRTIVRDASTEETMLENPTFMSIVHQKIFKDLKKGSTLKDIFSALIVKEYDKQPSQSQNKLTSFCSDKIQELLEQQDVTADYPSLNFLFTSNKKLFTYLILNLLLENSKEGSNRIINPNIPFAINAVLIVKTEFASTNEETFSEIVQESIKRGLSDSNPKFIYHVGKTVTELERKLNSDGYQHSFLTSGVIGNLLESQKAMYIEETKLKLDTIMGIKTKETLKEADKALKLHHTLLDFNDNYILEICNSEDGKLWHHVKKMLLTDKKLDSLDLINIKKAIKDITDQRFVELLKPFQTSSMFNDAHLLRQLVIRDRSAALITQSTKEELLNIIKIVLTHKQKAMENLELLCNELNLLQEDNTQEIYRKLTLNIEDHILVGNFNEAQKYANIIVNRSNGITLHHIYANRLKFSLKSEIDPKHPKNTTENFDHIDKLIDVIEICQNAHRELQLAEIIGVGTRCIDQLAQCHDANVLIMTSDKDKPFSATAYQSDRSILSHITGLLSSSSRARYNTTHLTEYFTTSLQDTYNDTNMESFSRISELRETIHQNELPKYELPINHIFVGGPLSTNFGRTLGRLCNQGLGFFNRNHEENGKGSLSNDKTLSI